MDEAETVFPLKASKMEDVGVGLGFSLVGLRSLLLIGMLFMGMSCALGSVDYSYEIVIPRKLTFKNREGPERKVSYLLYMRGKRLVIHLKLKKGLFVKNFPVYTYIKENLDMDIPFIQDDCYYDGYVEGELGSLVSISTCSGLQGIISLDRSVYGIEPIETLRGFEHVLYHMDGHLHSSCRVTAEEGQRFRSSVQKQRKEEKETLETEALAYIWSHTKYMEMFVVVDNRRFKMWNSNVTKTVRMVMDTLAHVNTYSQGIHVKVVLIGLEIWTERNQVRISGDLREVLHNFNHWREEELVRRAKHDIAHLIVGYDPGESRGEAFLNGACVPELAAAVESFSHEDPTVFAVLMVHELGHNLGMKHDHLACMCPDQPSCIMLGTISFESSFSNCSLEDFYEFLRRHKGSCLYDKPVPRGMVRKPFCGDHVVDLGEECDCGSHRDCMKDPCCLPSCQMRPGSDCAFGPCCRKCKFLKAATPCRPSMGECDLPEYCNGSSMWCQPDTYKQDGTPCRDEGYCYQGQCRSLQSQCVEVFGEGSRAARHSCYHHLNSQGDRFGNCGSGQKGLHKVFVKCEPEDVMCGRLLCEDIPRLPQTRNHHTLIQIPVEDTWCWGVDLFEDVDLPDGGAVRAGTLCGPQKICLNHTCSDVQVLQYDCEPEAMCHGRGVCNNLKHCHCDDGYAPPTCDSMGSGGSVDSGPPVEVGTSLEARDPYVEVTSPSMDIRTFSSEGRVSVFEEAALSAQEYPFPTPLEPPTPEESSTSDFTPLPYPAITCPSMVINSEEENTGNKSFVWILVSIIFLVILLAFVSLSFFYKIKSKHSSKELEKEKEKEEEDTE
ncbi:disintegrin and metalloproteinase domain-containing protein 1a-like [Trichosurus vulpecula]|uniref:disintegrin and metalloproteinase domain-containing protein 1a-like n=1 Tax=Trichosurus vulpecula TaxID=9337 RepID=UPI00186AC48C|nr:disintegrin and metalloproteinase domain-containing protein 1a-like [Trichosurus vulpecula]